MNWNTRVTELLNIKYPIIQGGLAYLGYSDLAAAVSNAGGLGQITAMTLETPEMLREEIQKVRERTNQPFSVNFAFGHYGQGHEEKLKIVMEEKVPVVSLTGANPTPIFELLKGTDIKKLVLVASKRQAQKAEQLGADAVMVVGHEGGGHLGRDDVSTMVLVPQVVDSVSIPVIASGGIGDGRGWMAAHMLGAEGIEMGTRFVATKECVHASAQYIEAIVNSTEVDTTIIKRSLGSPARVLRTDFTEKILEIEKISPTYEALKEHISGKANKKFIHDGDASNGFGWAGQVVGLIKDVPTVEELIGRMVAEAQSLRLKWGQ
ncbi:MULTISPECIES: nitronate monooxygenase family protein [Lysinibacillus]|uniref:Probable nitronate monooxygenase n=1 Tax=Lysinibacillus antri TaxID=2498145 RepID=A0A3S0P7Q1_9BACI|nr:MULTISPECIES: nitronate monooxygenase family protein [Lysinibacillus]RUL51908.1 nitronate monooxygenase [Lysinibacillus antri]TSI09286.1 nitronate monooxygenase [Lysinibacillus sp. BW-2-10]